MMALAVPTPPTQPRRVKVYELRNNDWYDRGTGYCTGALVNVSYTWGSDEAEEGGASREGPTRRERARADGTFLCVQEEPHIQVKSEEESDRVLLDTRIIKDDGYQKQQETLIVWTEPQGTDMALSFQEAEGCAAIWDFVSNVQSNLVHHLGGADEILSDEAESASLVPVVQLPDAQLGKLAEIESMLRQTNLSVHTRDAVAKFIISENYVAKLLPLLEVAEDLESLENLHRLCTIMKMIILLNDTIIIERIVTDEMVMGVVGILEYDPDFPSHKANHRQYLSDKSKFKEVVPIKDDTVRKKIHQTYRLQYLKDVVLARILDDPTFSVLNSLIFFNQFDILQHLEGNPAFLQELFAIFNKDSDADADRRRNAVQFIQQCCNIAKSLQPQARSQLYQHFIQHGLFHAIDYALSCADPSVRIIGTDVLVSMIDHDPAMMRGLIFRQITDKKKPLTDTLIELLLGEQDMGVKAQIAEAMKVLLDMTQPQPLPQEGMQKGGASEVNGRIQRTQVVDGETESFIKSFYEESAKKLFAPLLELKNRETLNLTITEINLFLHLVEALCFFIRTHSYRSKYFLLTEELPSRVAQLLATPEKPLKLTALKFFRTCVNLNDEFYIRHMMKYKLFEPILELVIETMPRDNLINSACLEFFEYIKRENQKPLIAHLVENYRDKMETITYVDTFANLVLRYEQHHEAAQPGSAVDDGSAPRRNGTSRWQGVKDMDPDEEAYFNASDSDDDDDAAADGLPAISSLSAATSQAAKSVFKPLVEYEDGDSDDDENEDDMATQVGSPPPPPHSARGKRKDRVEEASAALALTFKKRRRSEEEEDDEEDGGVFGRLAAAKGRGTAGRVGGAGGASAGGLFSPLLGSPTALSKKRSFAGSLGDAAAGEKRPGKKIAIRFSGAGGSLGGSGLGGGLGGAAGPPGDVDDVIGAKAQRETESAMAEMEESNVLKAEEEEGAVTKEVEEEEVKKGEGESVKTEEEVKEETERGKEEDGTAD